MKKIKGHLKNNRILYRMIALLLLLTTLLIALMTTIIYSRFREEIQAEIFNSEEQKLLQIANTVAFRAEYANYLMLQVKQNSDLSGLFYASDRGIKRGELNTLYKFRTGVKQLESIYIYNPHENIIYSSSELSTVSQSSVDSFVDKGFVEILENIDQYPKYAPFLRRISFERTNGRMYDVYVYTYLLYDQYNANNIKNIVAFNFYLGWMKDAISFITSDRAISEDIWIIDGNHQILYAKDENLIGSYYEEKAMSEMTAQPSGYFFEGSGAEMRMAVYASSEYAGYDNWTFIAWKDYASIIEPVNMVRRHIYVICFVAFVLSAAVIVALSIIVYEPVKKINAQIKYLEEEQKQKKYMEQRAFLRKLFVGDLQDDIDVISKGFAENEIIFEVNGSVQVLLVSIDYLGSFLREYASNVDEMEELFGALLKERMNEIWKLTIGAKMQHGVWVVAVPEDQPDNSRIHTLFKEFNEILQERYGISVSIVASSIGHSVRDIAFLYPEATNLHEYLYLYGQNRVITIEDIAQHGLDKFEYPHKTEKKFLTALLAGKKAEAIEAYKEFVDEIYFYTIDEIKLSFLLLAYAVKAAFRDSAVENATVLIEFNPFVKKLQSLETIDEVNQMFGHLVDEIAGKMYLYSRERHEGLIEQVKQYVAANCGSTTLSINEIADSVNMSAAYLGRVFKQVTEITFTEYLTRYRLNKACDMLNHTEMTINEISDAVGFTNSSYFYIVFKKYMNTTPSKYRGRKETEEERNG